MAEHRVPMLGSSWRRHEDPAQSRDPRVRAVVGALAELPAPELRPEFRAELRAQLVAITPRIVTDHAQAAPMLDVVPGTAARPRPTPHGRARSRPAPAKHSDRFLDRLRGLHLGRPLAVTAAVIVAFAVLLGGAVMMSKKSLPGDALYGLKRASERFELATAGSDTEKARDYLDFATTRANEVKDLLGRATASGVGGAHAAGGVSSGTAKLIRSTLGSADADVRSAARLLGNQAVRRGSAAPLATMTSWTPGQLHRLQAIAAATPDPALRARTLESVRLVQAAQARAKALGAALHCPTLRSGGTDALGPVPPAVCRDAATQQPGQTRANQPRTGHSPKGVVPGTSRVPGAPGSSSAPAGAGAGSTPGGSATRTSPGLQLPSLPSLPSSPVTLDSCSASVSLPVLGIGVTLCDGVGVHVGS